MYQFRSCGDLCSSKKMFETRKEILAHLGNVVALTEKYRKSLPKEDLEIVKWHQKVSKEEMIDNVFVTIIDEEKEINDFNLRNFVRSEKLRIKELERKKREKITIKIV
jgi:hypothetical protein